MSEQWSDRTIIGTVTSDRAHPIEGAKIELFEAGDPVRTHPLEVFMTDMEGKYALDASVLEGEYIVRAAKKGFLPKELNIKAGNGITTYPDLWLETAEKPTVHITIEPGDHKPLRMLFGFNEYAIESFPYYPFNDPAYVAVMKQSGAAIMRFPGGTIANFYDWADDDFMTEDLRKVSAADSVPRDRFATEDEYWAIVSKFSNYLQSYINKGTRCTENRGKYGYEDFLDMTRQIGADIFYVGNISMAPGDIDPVDHLTAWMRKLKNDGIIVKYLELGNEVVTPAAVKNVQAIANGLYDLDTYMRVAERAARAVKNIFPQIKIGILADGLGNKIGAHPGEIDILCRKIANDYRNDFYDAVVIHSYLRTTDRNDEGLQIRKDKLMAQSKQIVENSINHWRRVFPGKEIWMTETEYIAGTKEDEAHFTGNMCTAVLEADYFLRWVDHDDLVTSYVKFYSIGSNKNIKSTMFWNNETHEIVKNPNSYMYSMIAGVVKNSSGKLNVSLQDSDGYLVKAHSWMQSKDSHGEKIAGRGETKILDVEVEYVTARAFLSKDAKTIFVPFINKSQAPREVTVRVAGAPLEGAILEIRSLSGDIESTNTLANPHNIVPVVTQQPADRSVELPAFSTGVITIIL